MFLWISENIRLLCLEDVIDDAIIIKEYLKSEGLNFHFEHALTETEYTEI